ncbi:unnamed protein product [Enterobius vermicularis]|uniref:Uncharacterized protein n=1 Tax=Enterobius vermicularis TaxID=51028 RepID=A0A0N4VN36_ENTVE|nr:unnamed protein product [Enterobius vermicularis]
MDLMMWVEAKIRGEFATASLAIEFEEPSRGIPASKTMCVPSLSNLEGQAETEEPTEMLSANKRKIPQIFRTCCE